MGPSSLDRMILFAVYSLWLGSGPKDDLIWHKYAVSRKTICQKLAKAILRNHDLPSMFPLSLTQDDMSKACEGAKQHIIRKPSKPASLAALYTLSNQATHEAVHLLCQVCATPATSANTITTASTTTSTSTTMSSYRKITSKKRMSLQQY